ncbi:MAG: putative small protein [Moorella sp. (in: firmicutes)]|nr:putative small protein [Moorella sp. (in: firmicutes)]
MSTRFGLDFHNMKTASKTGSEKWPGSITPEEELFVLEILRVIRGVRHGSVQIVVRDGRVVQIDRTEKNRLV